MSNRQQPGVNLLIPKEVSNYQMDRQLTILLYEADFNFNNKILGTKNIHRSEKQEILKREQYGNRKIKQLLSIHSIRV